MEICDDQFGCGAMVFLCFFFFFLDSRLTTGRHLVHLVDFYRDCVDHS